MGVAVKELDQSSVWPDSVWRLGAKYTPGVMRFLQNIEPLSLGEVSQLYNSYLHRGSKSFIEFDRSTLILKDNLRDDIARSVDVGLNPNERAEMLRLATEMASVGFSGGSNHEARNAANEFNLGLGQVVFSRASDPVIVEWARVNAGRLIVEINEATRNSIANIVADGIRAQIGVEGTARRIRDLIGLTQFQGSAALRHREEMIASGYGGARLDQAYARYLKTKIRERAELIANNEIHVAVATGQNNKALALGRTEKDWITVGDERVSPTICRPNSALGRIPINQVFPNSGSQTTPGHPKCRCFPSGIVISGTRAKTAMRRFYSGEIVELKTRSGHSLPVTPHHPLLTSKGWVISGAINKGDQVFTNDYPERMLDLVDAHDVQIPTTIEKVFDSLAEFGRECSLLSNEDFHGDSADGQICVIASNGGLFPNLESSSCHPSFELVFSQSVLGQMGCSDIEPVLVGASLAHHEAVRLGNVPRGQTGFSESFHDWASARPKQSADLVRRTARVVKVSDALEANAFSAIKFYTAQLDSSVDKNLAYGCDTATVLFRKALDGLSSEIVLDQFLSVYEDGRSLSNEYSASLENQLDGVSVHLKTLCELAQAGSVPVILDDIVDVRLVPFHGYVYNVESLSGWVTANGIISHNCTNNYYGGTPTQIFRELRSPRRSAPATVTPRPEAPAKPPKPTVPKPVYTRSDFVGLTSVFSSVSLPSDLATDTIVKYWNKTINMSPKDFFSRLIAGVAPSPGILKLHLTTKGIGFIYQNSKEGIYFQRSIFGAGKTIEVHHDIFQVNAASQGGGIAKRLLGNSMELYKQIGVNEVTTHANIDVGAYSWAKYGFIPRDKYEWEHLSFDVRSGAEGLMASGLITKTQLGEIKQILELNKENPYAVWRIADLTNAINLPGIKDPTVGKALLFDRSWQATLSLSDEKAMSRFNAYVYKKK